MLKQTGVPSAKQIHEQFPHDEGMLQKPKAIIECYEDIPCNPCATSCPFDAITIPENINVRPRIDFERCTGCAICVYRCPGLAITVFQTNADNAIMKLPYEFTPLPEVGDTLRVLDRGGNPLTNGKVLKVQHAKAQNKTALIHIEFPKAHLYEAITIEVKRT